MFRWSLFLEWLPVGLIPRDLYSDSSSCAFSNWPSNCSVSSISFSTVEMNSCSSVSYSSWANSGLIIPSAAYSPSDCLLSMIILDRSFCCLPGDWSRLKVNVFEAVSIVLLENFVGTPEDWRLCPYFFLLSFEMRHVAPGIYEISNSFLELGLIDVSSNTQSPVLRVISSVVGKPSVLIGNASLTPMTLLKCLPRILCCLLSFAVWSLEL